jgi:hypothetical protein
MEAFTKLRRKKEIREVTRLVELQGELSGLELAPAQISQCNETFGTDLSSETRSGLERRWHGFDDARATISSISSCGSALTFVRCPRASTPLHLNLPETVLCS